MRRARPRRAPVSPRLCRHPALCHSSKVLCSPRVSAPSAVAALARRGSPCVFHLVSPLAIGVRMIEQSIYLLAAIGIIGIGCQWLAWWLKLPAILFLLLAGIGVGPLTGILQPDRLFGELLFPIVSLGVAVILFEGSLTLRLHEIKGLGSVVRNLVTIGALLTAVVIAVAARLLLNFPWELALLFGALVCVTGPTVIVPMLRTVRPKANLDNILRWEGIITDPLGALIAVLVYEFIVSGRGEQAHTLGVFGKMLLAGGVCGAGGALLLATILRRHLMPEYLHNVATLALVLGVSALANYFQHESGLRTVIVTVMGMLLANMQDVPIDDILDFKESLSVMLISLLFIVLAALVSSFGSTLHWRERELLCWIAPRGIVAAAVSALFALRLEDTIRRGRPAGAAHFMVIIGTVVLQSGHCTAARQLAQGVRARSARCADRRRRSGVAPAGAGARRKRVPGGARRQSLGRDQRGAHGGTRHLLRQRGVGPCRSPSRPGRHRHAVRAVARRRS